MPPSTKLSLSFVIATPADARAVTAALNAAPIASLTLTPAPGTNALAVLKPAVHDAQKLGIAVLINADAGLARTLKADGIHVPWSATAQTAYGEARGQAGSHMMIGADAGRSRHTAMELGEADADYVAFGIPDHVGDRATAENRQVDLIAWWSDIFQIPCMATNVTSPQHAQRLANAGADFVCVDVQTSDAASVVSLIETYQQAVATPRVTA